MGEAVDDGTGGLSGRIIAAAIEGHRYFGPGLLESAYEECPVSIPFTPLRPPAHLLPDTPFPPDGGPP